MHTPTGEPSRTRETGMSTQSNFSEVALIRIRNLIDHATACEPCRIRLLALVEAAHRPHRMEIKLLHSMYNSTENDERNHPR